MPVHKYCSVCYLRFNRFHGMEEVVGSIPIRSAKSRGQFILIPLSSAEPFLRLRTFGLRRAKSLVWYIDHDAQGYVDIRLAVGRRPAAFTALCAGSRWL